MTSPTTDLQHDPGGPGNVAAMTEQPLNEPIARRGSDLIVPVEEPFDPVTGMVLVVRNGRTVGEPIRWQSLLARGYCVPIK